MLRWRGIEGKGSGMKRRRFSQEFKAKVALEAIKGQRTANELSQEFGVHVNQINLWKKQLLEAAPEVFSRGKDREGDDPRLSVRRQCELIGLPRSSYYRELGSESAGNVELMRLMGLASIAPRKRTTAPGDGHRIYPYLLRNLDIDCPDKVWCSDITYIRLRGGFVYLTVVMDWYSRYVLSWEISVTMDESFCVSALERALRCQGRPEIFNTDQGSQYTGEAFTGVLKDHGIRISMDGKGRAMDNIMVERLWRTVKYEDIYTKDYESVEELVAGLRTYFWFYNNERTHQSLWDKTPAETYRGGSELRKAA
jgi:putative transposase